MQGVATFEASGFAVAPEVLSDAQCAELEVCVNAVDVQGAGTRELLSFDWAQQFARQLRALPVLAALLGDSRTAVQCTYFAKVSSRNWLVALHQDLSIPVAARTADAPCKAWSEKEGTWFCQPPADLLALLVAVRVHLDDSTEANGPCAWFRGRIGSAASPPTTLHIIAVDWGKWRALRLGAASWRCARSCSTPRPSRPRMPRAAFCTTCLGLLSYPGD